MIRIVLVLGCLVCLAAPALAQVDAVPDGIGIYADTGATTVNISATPNVIIPAYLVITRPSGSRGVAAWAARVVVPANAQILGWSISGFSMNVASPPQFVVARGSDFHPWAEAITVMTFYVMMSDGEPALFYLEGAPLAGRGFDEHPVYLETGDNNTPHYLHSYPNGQDHPVFAINSAPLPPEGTSWGEVKALFR